MGFHIVDRVIAEKADETPSKAWHGVDLRHMKLPLNTLDSTEWVRRGLAVDDFTVFLDYQLVAVDPDDRGARQTDHRITTTLFTTLDRLQEIAVRPTRKFDIATDRCLKISQYLPDQWNAVIARSPVTGEISAARQDTSPARRQPARRGTEFTEFVGKEVRVTDSISNAGGPNESATQIRVIFSCRS